MSADAAVMRLELISAKAKQLAEDLKHGKLWPGDLQRGIAEMTEQLSRAANEAR